MTTTDGVQTAVLGAFLETQSTLALATIGAEGNPHVAPLFYVSDERLNLFWLSSATSRHSLNLAERGRAAATIYPSVWGWRDIVGLQIEGEAHAIVDDRMREQMMVLYLRKFQLPPELDAQITASVMYVLRPAWIRWMDNSVAFAYKAEITAW